MQLFYTNAEKKGGVQPNPNNSLGGITSSSVIPNDYLGNIFSEASLLGQQEQKREAKLIVLKNTTSATVSGVQMTIGIPSDTIADYKIAFSNPTDVSCETFEKINNSSTLPYYAQFTNLADGDILNIPNLAVNQLLGIWLVRTLKKPVVKTCDDFAADVATLKAGGTLTAPSTTENLTFDISWN